MTFDLYRRAFAALDYKAAYLPYELPSKNGQPDHKGLRNLLHHFRCDPRLSTLVISDPYKQRVQPYLDEVTLRAEQSGAINLIYKQEAKLVGDNLDAEAFCSGFKHESGYDLANRRMVFFGCGGVSSAVATKLAPHLKSILLVDVDKSKAEELQRRLTLVSSSLDCCIIKRTGGIDFSHEEVFYNGTGLGKYSQDPARLAASPLLATDILPSTGLAIDANYTPWETSFLQSFRARSFPVVNGFSHMVGFVTLHLSLITEQAVEYSLIKNLARQCLSKPGEDA